MRHCGGSLSDQDEVLDNCCHVTSALGTFRSEIMLLQIYIYNFSLNFDYNKKNKYIK